MPYTDFTRRAPESGSVAPRTPQTLDLAPRFES